MASENRSSPHSLMTELERAPERFDFFEALRLIECMNPQRPRLGTSVKASDDPIRLSQLPELEFPPCTLSHFKPNEAVSNKSRLSVNFMGLFGPNGPLPLHLTEYARERLRHHHDPTLARFADIFHHRMISLFYRAWANTRPTVSYDRPDSDRFSFYVGSLLGVGGEAFKQRDALDDRAKRYYSGHFSAKSQSPSGLRAIISDILQASVDVSEFVGEWMAIQRSDQTRLGMAPKTASLGESALLGAVVWGCQHKFRLILGPLTLQQYLALLPGGTSLPQLIAIVRNYVGDAFVWEAQLILDNNQVPAELALGKPESLSQRTLNGEAQLGWSMWLGPRGRADDAKDLLLNPFINSNL